MNGKKVVTCNIAIFVFIFFIICTAGVYFNFEQENSIPDIMEYKKINNNGIDFKALSNAKEKLEDIECTGYSEESCNIKNSYGISVNKDIKTKLVMADDKYFSIYPYKFIKGGKIDHISIENASKVVVISDKLANSLYKNTNVIGNKISIDDSNYEIIGVYEDNDSFIYNMAGDGYERVIIPYSGYKLDDKENKLFVDVFAVKENKANSYEKIDYKIGEALEGKQQLYAKNNYTLSKRINSQYIKISIFLVGVYFIILLIKLIILYFKKFIEYISSKLKNRYIKEIIKEERKGIIVFLIKVTLCLAGIIIIVNLIKFNLVVKNEFIPPDNIFDIEFYKNAIIKNNQLINANESGFNNIYNRYLTLVGNIEKPLVLMQIINFIVVYINIRMLKKIRRFEKQEIL